MKNFNVFVIGAPLFAIALVAIRVFYSASIWRYEGPDAFFYIKPQETFSSINFRLAESGFISSSRLFHRYSQWKGSMTKFKSGQYKIKSQSNLFDVYNTLMNEKGLATYFTIPEGKNMYEIGKMLEQRLGVNYQDFITLCKDQSFVNSLGIKGETVEGYLYPDTYDFGPNLSPREIIKTMVRQFNKKTADVDFYKQRLSKEQIIVLASMVEKETGDDSERAIIAGVFYNRLKIKMRLQSDPTTIYGMIETYKGNITKKDLLAPSEYNTYTLAALPKGPIANPGIHSILAVLNPAKHSYLYFVSQNEGTHIFSETYEKHQEAVKKWQKTLKNREGKSWRNKKSIAPPPENVSTTTGS